MSYTIEIKEIESHTNVLVSKKDAETLTLQFGDGHTEDARIHIKNVDIDGESYPMYALTCDSLPMVQWEHCLRHCVQNIIYAQLFSQIDSELQSEINKLESA